MTLPGLHLVRISRQDVSGSTTPSQPSVWTFLDFEPPDDGWYADCQSSIEI